VLIDSFDIEFDTPDCQHPSCDELFARVKVKADLTELIPYVNAVVRGQYLPAVPVVTWKADGRNFALRPHEVAIGDLESRESGLEVIRGTVEWLNGIWERHAELTPDHTVREKPKVLDVYKLLPRTNCKECGLPSCMGYAGELAAGNKSLDGCPPLHEESNREALERLLDMGL
jgi:ArsR family metal-binding transcriptional regulator